MTPKELKTKSKLLSLLLRHAPEKAGLSLMDGGWVRVEDLIAGLARMNKHLDRAELEVIVRDNDKKRFSFSDDKTLIRAAQGHSTSVEMYYVASTPPDALFHGTATKALAAILQEGLKPQSRQYVHLSLNVETATKVGMRHGKPVILTVDTIAMSQDGYVFYVADNGVWLTSSVPPQYLKQYT